jgi:glutamate-1-semialdehyde 2,1-aminomutase
MEDLNMDITKSMEMQRRAGRLIPGMTQLLSKRPDRFSLGVWPGYFSKAKGVHVWDLDGNRYLDMSLCGVGANILGYGDPDVDDAVRKAIDMGTGCTLNCPEEVELAELLCRLHPWAEMARFARTGGEAMAIAIRIARARTGRDKIAFCGYHGWHDWYLAANLGTENALGEHLISGLNPVGVPKGLKGTTFPFRYNHLEDLEKIIADHGKDLAAIVMEPIRDHDPETGFLEGVRRLADKVDAVLIVDEISAAFRLTTGGAHLVLKKDLPDMAVFSKALGNGYPIASIIGKAEIMEAAQETFISSTNWTERIGPSAAIATINKHLALNAAEHLIKLGEWVQQGWSEAAVRHNLAVQVGGMKPMSHFVFESKDAPSLKAYFIQLMLDQGFLASNHFYAMHAHSREDVERYLTAVDESFGKVAKALDQGNVKDRLRGLPSAAGFKRLT